MSGWDHDFIIGQDPQWLLRRFTERLRHRWPRIVVGVELEMLASEGTIPGRFPDFVEIARDVEMLRWTYEHGGISNAQGESSVGVLQLPQKAGYVQIDIILAESRPHWFTEQVLESFFAALCDGYRRHSGPDLEAEGEGPSAQHLVFVAPVETAWIARAAHTCAQKRWRGQAEGNGLPESPRKQLGDAWEFSVQERRGTLKGGGERKATFSFKPARGRRGTMIGVAISRHASPGWRSEVLCVLEEAVGLWHFVSYRSMKPLCKFTWPPGNPVLKEGIIEFEDEGGTPP